MSAHKLKKLIRLRNIGLIIVDWLRRMPAARYLHCSTRYRKAGISIIVIVTFAWQSIAWAHPVGSAPGAEEVGWLRAAAFKERGHAAQGKEVKSLYEVLANRRWHIFGGEDFGGKGVVLNNISIRNPSFTSAEGGYRRINDTLIIKAGKGAILIIGNRDIDSIHKFLTHECTSCIAVSIMAPLPDGRKVFYLSHFLNYEYGIQGDARLEKESDDVEATLAGVLRVLGDLGAKLKDMEAVIGGGYTYCGVKYAKRAISFFEKRRIRLDAEHIGGAVPARGLYIDTQNNTARVTPVDSEEEDRVPKEIKVIVVADTGGWVRPDISVLKPQQPSQPLPEEVSVTAPQALEYVQGIVKSYCDEKNITFDEKSCVILGEITDSDRAAAGIRCAPWDKEFYRTAIVFEDRDGRVKVKFDPHFVGRIMAYRGVSVSLKKPIRGKKRVTILELDQSLIFRTVIHEIGKHAAGGRSDITIVTVDTNEALAEGVSSEFAPYNQGARLFDRIFHEEGITQRNDFAEALRRYLIANPILYGEKLKRNDISNAAIRWYDAWANTCRTRYDEAQKPSRRYCIIQPSGSVQTVTQPVMGKATFDTGIGSRDAKRHSEENSETRILRRLRRLSSINSDQIPRIFKRDIMRLSEKNRRILFRRLLASIVPSQLYSKGQRNLIEAIFLFFQDGYLKTAPLYLTSRQYRRLWKIYDITKGDYSSTESTLAAIAVTLRDDRIHIEGQPGKRGAIKIARRRLSGFLSTLNKKGEDLDKVHCHAWEQFAVSASRPFLDIVAATAERHGIDSLAFKNIFRFVLTPASDYSNEARAASARLIVSQVRLSVPERANSARQACLAIFGGRNNIRARKFFKMASLLRKVYPYELTKYDPRPPLQYALEEGIYFRIGPNLYMTPVTEGFRRHLIFGTDEDGYVKFASAVVIPGEMEGKHDVGAEDRFDISRDLLRNFPGKDYCPRPVYIKVFPPGAYEFYGQTLEFDHEAPLNIMAYEYSMNGNVLDAKRLDFMTSGMLDTIAAGSGIERKKLDAIILRRVAELTAAPHFLGYAGHYYDERGKLETDSHIGNFEMVRIGKEIRIRLVGDFACFADIREFEFPDFERNVDCETIMGGTDEREPSLINLLSWPWQKTSRRFRASYNAYLGAMKRQARPSAAARGKLRRAVAENKERPGITRLAIPTAARFERAPLSSILRPRALAERKKSPAEARADEIRALMEDSRWDLAWEAAVRARDKDFCGNPIFAQLAEEVGRTARHEEVAEWIPLEYRKRLVQLARKCDSSETEFREAKGQKAKALRWNAYTAVLRNFAVEVSNLPEGVWREVNRQVKIYGIPKEASGKPSFKWPASKEELKTRIAASLQDAQGEIGLLPAEAAVVLNRRERDACGRAILDTYLVIVQYLYDTTKPGTGKQQLMRLSGEVPDEMLEGEPRPEGSSEERKKEARLTALLKRQVAYCAQELDVNSAVELLVRGIRPLLKADMDPPAFIRGAGDIYPSLIKIKAFMALGARPAIHSPRELVELLRSNPVYRRGLVIAHGGYPAVTVFMTDAGRFGSPSVPVNAIEFYPVDPAKPGQPMDAARVQELVDDENKWQKALAEFENCNTWDSPQLPMYVGGIDYRFITADGIRTLVSTVFRDEPVLAAEYLSRHGEPMLEVSATSQAPDAVLDAASIRLRYYIGYFYDYVAEHSSDEGVLYAGASFWQVLLEPEYADLRAEMDLAYARIKEPFNIEAPIFPNWVNHLQTARNILIYWDSHAMPGAVYAPWSVVNAWDNPARPENAEELELRRDLWRRASHMLANISRCAAKGEDDSYNHIWPPVDESGRILDPNVLIIWPRIGYVPMVSNDDLADLVNRGEAYTNVEIDGAALVINLDAQKGWRFEISGTNLPETAKKRLNIVLFNGDRVIIDPAAYQRYIRPDGRLTPSARGGTLLAEALRASPENEHAAAAIGHVLKDGNRLFNAFMAGADDHYKVDPAFRMKVLPQLVVLGMKNRVMRLCEIMPAQSLHEERIIQEVEKLKDPKQALRVIEDGIERFPGSQKLAQEREIISNRVERERLIDYAVRVARWSLSKLDDKKEALGELERFFLGERRAQGVTPAMFGEDTEACQVWQRLAAAVSEARAFRALLDEIRRLLAENNIGEARKKLAQAIAKYGKVPDTKEVERLINEAVKDNARFGELKEALAAVEAEAGAEAMDIGDIGLMSQKLETVKTQCKGIKREASRAALAREAGRIQGAIDARNVLLSAQVAAEVSRLDNAVVGLNARISAAEDHKELTAIRTEIELLVKSVNAPSKKLREEFPISPAVAELRRLVEDRTGYVRIKARLAAVIAAADAENKIEGLDPIAQRLGPIREEFPTVETQASRTALAKEADRIQAAIDKKKRQLSFEVGREKARVRGEVDRLNTVLADADTPEAVAGVETALDALLESIAAPSAAGVDDIKSDPRIGRLRQAIDEKKSYAGFKAPLLVVETKSLTDSIDTEELMAFEEELAALGPKIEALPQASQKAELTLTAGRVKAAIAERKRKSAAQVEDEKMRIRDRMLELSTRAEQVKNLAALGPLETDLRELRASISPDRVHSREARKELLTEAENLAQIVKDVRAALPIVASLDMMEKQLERQDLNPRQLRVLEQNGAVLHKRMEALNEPARGKLTTRLGSMVGVIPGRIAAKAQTIEQIDKQVQQLIACVRLIPVQGPLGLMKGRGIKTPDGVRSLAEVKEVHRLLDTLDPGNPPDPRIKQYIETTKTALDRAVDRKANEVRLVIKEDQRLAERRARPRSARTQHAPKPPQPEPVQEAGVQEEGVQEAGIQEPGVIEWQEGEDPRGMAKRLATAMGISGSGIKLIQQVVNGLPTRARFADCTVCAIEFVCAQVGSQEAAEANDLDGMAEFEEMIERCRAEIVSLLSQADRGSMNIKEDEAWRRCVNFRPANGQKPNGNGLNGIGRNGISGVELSQVLRSIALAERKPVKSNGLTPRPINGTLRDEALGEILENLTGASPDSRLLFTVQPQTSEEERIFRELGFSDVAGNIPKAGIIGELTPQLSQNNPEISTMGFVENGVSVTRYALTFATPIEIGGYEVRALTLVPKDQAAETQLKNAVHDKEHLASRLHGLLTRGVDFRICAWPMVLTGEEARDGLLAQLPLAPTEINAWAAKVAVVQRKAKTETETRAGPAAATGLSTAQDTPKAVPRLPKPKTAPVVAAAIPAVVAGTPRAGPPLAPGPVEAIAPDDYGKQLEVCLRPFFRGGFINCSADSEDCMRLRRLLRSNAVYKKIREQAAARFNQEQELADRDALPKVNMADAERRVSIDPDTLSLNLARHWSPKNGKFPTVERTCYNEFAGKVRHLMFTWGGLEPPAGFTSRTPLKPMDVFGIIVREDFPYGDHDFRAFLETRIEVLYETIKFLAQLPVTSYCDMGYYPGPGSDDFRLFMAGHWAARRMGYSPYFSPVEIAHLLVYCDVINVQIIEPHDGTVTPPGLKVTLRLKYQRSISSDLLEWRFFVLQRPLPNPPEEEEGSEAVLDDIDAFKTCFQRDRREIEKFAFSPTDALGNMERAEELVRLAAAGLLLSPDYTVVNQRGADMMLRQLEARDPTRAVITDFVRTEITEQLAGAVAAGTAWRAKRLTPEAAKANLDRELTAWLHKKRVAAYCLGHEPDNDQMQRFNRLLALTDKTGFSPILAPCFRPLLFTTGERKRTDGPPSWLFREPEFNSMVVALGKSAVLIRQFCASADAYAALMPDDKKKQFLDVCALEAPYLLTSNNKNSLERLRTAVARNLGGDTSILPPAVSKGREGLEILAKNVGPSIEQIELRLCQIWAALAYPGLSAEPQIIRGIVAQGGWTAEALRERLAAEEARFQTTGANLRQAEELLRGIQPAIQSGDLVGAGTLMNRIFSLDVQDEEFLRRAKEAIAAHASAATASALVFIDAENNKQTTSQDQVALCEARLEELVPYEQWEVVPVEQRPRLRRAQEALAKRREAINIALNISKRMKVWSFEEGALMAAAPGLQEKDLGLVMQWLRRLKVLDKDTGGALCRTYKALFSRGVAEALAAREKHFEDRRRYDYGEKGIQGERAEDANLIARLLLRKTRTVEIEYDGERLRAFFAIYNPDYKVGETPEERYRVEIDAEKFFERRGIGQREQENLMQWMREASQRLPPAPPGVRQIRYPRIKMILGQTTLRWDTNIEHSNIAHAGYRDRCIYMGEHLLRYLLEDAHRDLREDALTNDELWHLQDEKNAGHSPDDPAYQERKRKIAAAVEEIAASHVTISYTYDVDMNFSSNRLIITADHRHAFIIDYPFDPLRSSRIRMHEQYFDVEQRAVKTEEIYAGSQPRLYSFIFLICHALRPYFTYDALEEKIGQPMVNLQGKPVFSPKGLQKITASGSIASTVSVRVKDEDIFLDIIGYPVRISDVEAGGDELNLRCHTYLAYAPRVFDRHTRQEALTADYWEKFLAEAEIIMQPEEGPTLDEIKEVRIEGI